MRVAIIADTHLPRGGRRLPQSCLDRLVAADLIMHAGDFTARSVLAELEALGPPVRAVHGNVDEPLLTRLLDQSIELELEGARVAMIHDGGPASGRLERLRRRFPSADLVIFGHSHIPLHETGADGLQLFNPGSPTERRRAPHHTMGLATITRGAVALEHLVLA